MNGNSQVNIKRNIKVHKRNKIKPSSRRLSNIDHVQQLHLPQALGTILQGSTHSTSHESSKPFEYLVKWKGYPDAKEYPDDKTSWATSASNMTNAQDVIAEYEQAMQT